MVDETEVLERTREQFPIIGSDIYLDTANGSLPPLCVSSAVARYYDSLQNHGGDKTAWRSEVEAVRRKASDLLGCDESELAFCKNTSEGLNIAANAIAWQRGDNVVVPGNEHPNNVYPWLNLRRLGVEVRLVPVEGECDADALRPYVDGRTRAVTIADVSFHPGQRNDLDSIAALCDEKRAHLVVDGVQSAGLLDARLAERGIAMWAASGHKGLLSPHGMGLFYCRKDLIKNLWPVYLARAGTQPASSDDHVVPGPEFRLRDDARRFEIGNYNFSGTYAMSAALDLILGVGIDVIERHVLGLGEYVTAKLARHGIARIGPSVAERRSSICAFDFPGGGWVRYLAEHRIIVSERRGAVRVSMGIHNSRTELDEFVSVVERRIG